MEARQDDDVTRLRTKLEAVRQTHLLRWIDELDQDRQQDLIKTLSEVDFEAVERMKEISHRSLSASQDCATIEPLPKVISHTKEKEAALRTTGLESIGKGEVAVVLMAGGQGTRLGSDLPKGLFVVEGLPSKKSLFQIQAEKILALQRLSSPNDEKKTTIKWYVMTSDVTHDETVRFFEEKNYFGLEKTQIRFFQQGMVPCMDEKGGLLLANKSTLQLSPNGNGGIYQALKNEGIVEEMKELGVRWVFVYGVDNILVKIADPVMIATAIEEGADCVNKVVRKTDPSERVGLICLRGGSPNVVEYSEVSQEMVALPSPSDPSRLLFDSANICTHLYSLDFISRVTAHHLSEIPFHFAHKAIPFVDGETGELVTPAKPNGFKFEQFVFDVFPLVEVDKFVAIEVQRNQEFSPLKNRTGSDSPTTCARDLSLYHRSLLEAAGATFDGESEGVCEISPLVSYDGEGLASHFAGRVLSLPFHLDRLP